MKIPSWLWIIGGVSVGGYLLTKYKFEGSYRPSLAAIEAYGPNYVMPFETYLSALSRGTGEQQFRAIASIWGFELPNPVLEVQRAVNNVADTVTTTITGKSIQQWTYQDAFLAPFRWMIYPFTWWMQ